MSTQEPLEILRRGSQEWNDWRSANRSLKPQFIHEDLRGIHLEQVDLSGANLSGAKLDSAKLRAADFSYATLNGASFRGADLAHGNLARARLIGAHLIDADLTSADLGFSQLSEAKLDGAVLRYANLKAADLSQASLRKADLRDANLNAADFTGANLSDANLSGAVIEEVTFAKADLSAVRLTGATLNRVDLRDAKLAGAAFLNSNISGLNLTRVNLSGVDDLVAVTHGGPSELGHSTFEISEGKIPEQFLRGCGLKEWEVEAVKLHQTNLTPNQITEVIYKINELRSDPLIQFYSCFISYSHHEKDFARRLYEELQDRGVRCWLDEHQLLPGHDIYDEVDRGIRYWDKVLLCCSKSSLRSWWVDNEIQIAFDKEARLMKDRGKKVLALIPLSLDGYLLSGEWKSGKATQVTSRLAADFSEWEQDGNKFDDQLERLVRALRTDEGREEPPFAKI